MDDDYLYITLKKIIRVLKIIVVIFCILLLSWILNNFSEVENINMFLYIPCFFLTLFRKNNFMKITNEECSKMNSNFLLFLRS
jgi:hypothetical protein